MAKKIMSKYIVCEFPNEENKVSAAYSNWLCVGKDDAFDSDIITDCHLQKLIDNEELVKMQWPKNVEVGPCCTSMQKKLDKWDTVVAKLHAYSDEWTNMCQVVTNFNKYEIGVLSKDSRKNFTKKIISDDESDDNTKNLKESWKIKKEAEKKKEKALTRSRQKTWNKYKSHLKQTSLIQDADESADVEDQTVSQIKSSLMIEREENKRLRYEIARFNLLRGLREDLPEIKQDIQDLKDNLKNLKLSMKHLKDTVESLNNELHNNDISKKSPSVQNNDLYSKNATIGTDSKIIEKDEAVMINFENEERSNDIFDYENRQDNTTHLKNVNNNDVESEKEFVKNGNELELTATDCYKKTDFKVEPVKIDHEKFAKCDHSTAEKLICDLMSVVFSKHELATSSLIGQTSNFFQGKNIAPKKALDPHKIACVKDYVFKKFPRDKKQFEQMFRKAVQKKCNNAIPRKTRIKQTSEVRDASS